LKVLGGNDQRKSFISCRLKKNEKKVPTKKTFSTLSGWIIGTISNAFERIKKEKTKRLTEQQGDQRSL
jgi:hypothetical protein